MAVGLLSEGRLSELKEITTVQNARRWKALGVQPRYGGGRGQLVPGLGTAIVEFAQRESARLGRKLTQREVRNEAARLALQSGYKNFRASCGWYNKMRARSQLDGLCEAALLESMTRKSTPTQSTPSAQLEQSTPSSSTPNSPGSPDSGSEPRKQFQAEDA